jgi:alanyl-tRNA synthetase
MNQRAYYFDSYTVQFEATVIERLLIDDQPVVVLDNTFFYPTSGGQPCDLGKLSEAAVIDVLIRPEDGAVLHYLDRELAGDQVTATINWQRRFDHMQHHTGQHILSQAFIQVADAHTIGFHLSDASVTIDLDKRKLSVDDIVDVELLANEIVWQNRPVIAREVAMDEARKLPLRKIPPTQNGNLRLIDIQDFDLTACGGTHVTRTGEVGLIKVIKQERRGEKQRIEFRCGNRALSDYKEKNRIVAELTTRLTTGASELDAAVERLQDENKQARRKLKKQQTDLSRLEASNFINQALHIGDLVIVTQVFSDRDPVQVKALSNQLIRHDDVIALLGVAGKHSHLIFSRSFNAPGQMNSLLRSALRVLGSNSGGGSDTFAQGVGPAVDAMIVQQAVEVAKKELIEELNGIG